MRQRLDQVALALLLLGIVITVFLQAPGEIIADARYEHVGAPDRFLAGHASIWDDSRSLGQPARYFAPTLAALQAVVHLVAGTPWITQRVVHAVLLVAASLGTFKLARTVTGDNVVPVVAAAAYTFNPFTTQFLLPSGLFAAYAAAPWFAYAAMAGVRSRRPPWRAAAIFALAVFSLGMINMASLLAAMLATAAFVLAALATRRSTLRTTWAWIWRAMTLTAAVSAAMLTVLSQVGPIVRVNLQTTETPAAVATSSSASESWRGLGRWLTYLHIDGAPFSDQATAYFTHPLIIALSFSLMALAAWGLVRSRQPIAAALGVLAAVTVVLMVGIFPASDPAPLGQALDDAMSRSLFVRGFRSTYKAGPSFFLAIALLGGLGVADLRTSIRNRIQRPTSARIAWLLTVGLVAASLAVSSFPFWTGLYPSERRFTDLPEYWDEAFAWFDQQPEEPGVLVLPSMARTTYRWGFVNDTLFDAHLRQPPVGARTLPQSTAGLADLTEAIDAHLRSGVDQGGALGPMLRRLGVRWVLLQNDVDWLAADVARPLVYDSIRTDDDFVLAASFGTAGENVTGSVAIGNKDRRDSELAPIEVYELRDARAIGGIVSDGSILVTGAGDSWPGLATAGLLDRPVVYRGDMAAGEIASDAPDALVLTDGAQRRAGAVLSSQSWRSQVLGTGEDIGRAPQVLFDDIADQSIATWGDASSLSSTTQDWLWRHNTAWRAANAFDGNPHTAWATSAGAGGTLRVELAEPTDLQRVEISLLPEPNGQPADGVEVLVTVEGTQRALAFNLPVEGGTAILDDPSLIESTKALSFGLWRRSSVPMVGISEIKIATADGFVDAREFLRVPGPRDVAAREAWSDALEEVPVLHNFSRFTGPGGAQDESVVRRTFWNPGSTVEVEATIRIDDSTPDVVIDHLVGSAVSAAAEDRFNGDVNASARYAIDGRLDSAWQFDPTTRPAIEVTLPGNWVDQIELWSIVSTSADRRLSRSTGFDITVTDTSGETLTREVRLPDEVVCDPGFAALDEELCIERVVVRFPTRSITAVSVRSTDVEEVTAGFNRVPVQIAELRFTLRGTTSVTENALAPGMGCRDLFTIDNVPIFMRPSIPPTVDNLGQGLVFTSCEDVSLTSGWHRFDSGVGTSHAVANVSMRPADQSLPAAVTSPVTTLKRTSTTRLLQAEVGRGSVVVTDVPAHPGWKVSAAGVAGKEIIADGFVAFRAAEEGPLTLTLQFAPQRWYRFAWGVTAAAVMLCLWLVAFTRRTREGGNDG